MQDFARFSKLWLFARIFCTTVCRKCKYEIFSWYSLCVSSVEVIFPVNDNDFLAGRHAVTQSAGQHQLSCLKPELSWEGNLLLTLLRATIKKLRFTWRIFSFFSTSAQHLLSFCSASAQLLLSFCSASAQHLTSLWTCFNLSLFNVWLASSRGVV